MKTLIVFSTKYGTTEKCVNLLKEKIKGDVDLFNLKTKKDIDISPYDNVIIGGSVYMGNIQKEVKEFCAKNISPLKKKKIGLFICCMSDKETAKNQLEASYPKELLEKAFAKECFGGEFILSKMNFFHKLIVKKVSKAKEDKFNILKENIKKLAFEVNQFYTKKA